MTVIQSLPANGADALRTLATTTFSETYSGMIEEADLAAFLSEQFSPSEIRAGTAADAIRVACLESRMVGYSWVRPARLPNLESTASRPIELERLYLLASARGHGLGRSMVKDAESRAAESGHDCIWLKVWEHNPRALSFYESCGFTRIGECEFECGRLRCRDLVMIKPLG